MAGVTHINDAYCWNLSQIATAFDLHRETVRKRLREAGVRAARKQGNAQLYRLSEVGPVLFQPNAAALPDKYKVEDLGPKDRKEWFQSENERLKFQGAIGELIPADVYRDDLSHTLKKVVSFFESLPDKMERRRVFEPAQLEELTRATDEFRAQLYQGLLEVSDNG